MPIGLERYKNEGGSMDENEGQSIIFDEVWMQDVVAEWAKTYAEGVEVARWYYDPHRETLLVGLLLPEENQDQ